MEWFVENKVWKWLLENKEWLFSGIGVAAIAWIFSWVLKRKKGESNKNPAIEALKHEHKGDVTHIQAGTDVTYAKNGSKVVQVKKSPTGVIGDKVNIEGGIHFYSDQKNRENDDSDTDLETEIKAYRVNAESRHESIPVVGFATPLNVPINIEDIYVPLRAMVNLKGVDDIVCYGDSNETEECLVRCDAALEIPLIKAFSEAERRGRKGLVILGDPGSGKTTHLKRILLWCLRKTPQDMGLPENMLPVFLPLREIKHLEKGLDRFIQDQLTSRHLKMRPDFGQRLMKRGNLLFLLDGLDEVADLAQREEVSAWIEEAFTDYPDCRFVVTCRFAGYSPSVRLGPKFLEMHVRPLSEQEAERFIRNWYAIVEKSLAKDMEKAEMVAHKKADHLIKRLGMLDFRARRVFELTRNPLLLTNICLVHRQREGDLPNGRAGLYKECVDVLLERWRESKKLIVGVNVKQGYQVLQPAALWLHQEENRIRATASELAPVIEPALKQILWSGGDAQKFLETIRDESGLLTGWDQEHYGFMHLNFQEYLAAHEIRSRFWQEMKESGRSEMLKGLAQHFGESWWQEVTLLLLALEDSPLFVQYMREVVDHPDFSKHADLLEMCLDDAVEPSALPFVELLETQTGMNRKLWDRQLLSLRMVKRLDEKALKSIMDRLKDHPDDRIKQWIQDQFKQAAQDVIWPEPSGYEMVLIKGGTFMMGSEEHYTEKPVHKVILPDFYIGRYPVTNAEYERFIMATGHHEFAYWGDRNFNQPRQPVVGVSWRDAKAFAEWAGLQLPSEAQWEYACRAGSKTRYSWGEEPDCTKANYGNSEYCQDCKEINPGKPSAVGNYPPNAFGLYDMHGNVWEWCEDHWHDNYKGAPGDGIAWVAANIGEFGFLRGFIKTLFKMAGRNLGEGANRVIRGGAWSSDAEFCRSADRNGLYPVGRFFSSNGFRLVRLPGQPGEPGRSGKSRQGDA